MHEKPLQFGADSQNNPDSQGNGMSGQAAMSAPYEAAPQGQAAPLSMNSAQNERQDIPFLLNEQGQKPSASQANSQGNANAAYGSRSHGGGGSGGMPPPPPLVCCPYAPGGALFPQKSWRKRHPILFMLLILIIALVLFQGMAYVQRANMLAEPRIGVANIDGVILESGPVIDWLDTLGADANVKGVVVRINSPGGAVGPSQEIYAAVKRLADKKPVVISMGALAASGGYYIALGGLEIYASPSTLTASIGVIMEVPNFEVLLKNLGISSKTLVTGSLKGAGSSTREMTPEEEAYLQEILFDMYDEFITTVAERRKMPLDAVKRVADGRSMTGRQALKAGLIDALGDFGEAKRRVLQLCGVSEHMPVEIIEGPVKPTELWKELIEGILPFEVSQKVVNPQVQFLYQ